MAFIVHWNRTGLLGNLGDIKDIINKVSPIAFCLQETNLVARHKQVLKRFTVVRKDSEWWSSISGGVATAIQGNTPTREVKVTTRFEAICRLYIPPHTHTTTKL